MRKIFLALVFLAAPCSAQAQPVQESGSVWSAEALNNAKHPNMRLATGERASGEYIIVDTNGSVTRADCPYTCEDRGLPRKHCHAWPSISDKRQCYVQDTRIPSDVFPGKTSSGGHASSQSHKRKNNQ